MSQRQENFHPRQYFPSAKARETAMRAPHVIMVEEDDDGEERPVQFDKDEQALDDLRTTDAGGG